MTRLRRIVTALLLAAAPMPALAQTHAATTLYCAWESGKATIIRLGPTEFREWYFELRRWSSNYCEYQICEGRTDYVRVQGAWDEYVWRPSTGEIHFDNELWKDTGVCEETRDPTVSYY